MSVRTKLAEGKKVRRRFHDSKSSLTLHDNDEYSKEKQTNEKLKIHVGLRTSTRELVEGLAGKSVEVSIRQIKLFPCLQLSVNIDQCSTFPFSDQSNHRKQVPDAFAAPIAGDNAA